MVTVADDEFPAVTAAREVAAIATVKEWSDSIAMSSVIAILRDCTVESTEGGKVTDIPSANAKSSPSAAKEKTQQFNGISISQRANQAIVTLSLPLPSLSLRHMKRSRLPNQQLWTYWRLHLLIPE